MRFNRHSELDGRHAFLSASKYAWIRYDEAKVRFSFDTHLAARKGTMMHDLASKLIKMKVNLPDTGQTVNSYVNDAIGFNMESEVVLAYSAHAFGTADAISCRHETPDSARMTLRIHDLKTGINRAKFDQLMIYAAYFCLEYGIKNPDELDIELRIYQNDEVFSFVPESEDILAIMIKTKDYSKIIDEMEKEAFA